MDWDRESLEEWQRYQPLSVLQLDVADRAVLRVAGNLSPPRDSVTPVMILTRAAVTIGVNDSVAETELTTKTLERGILSTVSFIDQIGGSKLLFK